MNDGHVPVQVLAVGAEAADALARLHAAVFAAPWDADALGSLLASPFVFALQAGDPPVGFILARAVAEEAEILTLAVEPEARRRGVARTLVETAAGTAFALGACVLWLEVAEDNLAARTLYAHAGFEEAGRRRGYYRRGDGAVDALLLQRRLNTASA